MRSIYILDQLSTQDEKTAGSHNRLLRRNIQRVYLRVIVTLRWTWAIFPAVWRKNVSFRADIQPVMHEKVYLAKYFPHWLVGGRGLPTPPWLPQPPHLLPAGQPPRTSLSSIS